MPSRETPPCSAAILATSNKTDEAIASFAMTYADQNERDHQALLKTIRDGKIAVCHE
jgi:hypothetical protein